MVDQESRSYRPRRAFTEPEPEPTPPPAAAPAAAPVTTDRPAAPDFDDEDAPKPLYRDEYLPRPPHRDEPASNGNGSRPAPAVNGASTAPAAAPGPDASEVGSDDTAIRSFTFAPRTRRTGDDTTTILPRSGSTARGRSAPSAPSGPDHLHDEDEDDSRPIDERARWALIIGAIAAVVVLGLAIGYAVSGLGNDPGTAPAASNPSGSGGPAPTTSASAAPPAGGALLTTDMMLTAAQAKQLDDKRTWKEALTQRGASENAPVPACFGGEPDPGQPVSQQKILRVLSSSGKDAPSALHDATAYATPEEAAQAFAVASRTLGTCPAAGAYIAGGQLVRGVGEQAAGATIAVVDGKTTVEHNVVISRTGRVLNILDAGRPRDPVSAGSVAGALVEVTKKQCGPAGGKCGDGKAEVRNGPPPLGGDQPGFLAVGDLPPVAGSLSLWTAAPVELAQEDFVGSSCENVNWATVPAESREMRVYLHPESGNAYFGVNQIVLNLKDAKSADALVEKIKSDITDCTKRRLTATVSDPKKVSGVGARDAKIAGYTFLVKQKGTDGSDEFRVGIVQTGTKVAYSFANPKGDANFTDAQWNTIAVRAGERVTQVN